MTRKATDSGKSELWCWHSLRATGDTAIIEIANQEIEQDDARAFQAWKASCPQVTPLLTTIEQAEDYFLCNESGAVSIPEKD